MKLVGLSRQIMLAMMAIALGVTLLVILMSHAFYSPWQLSWPDSPLDSSWIPTGPEWIWVIGSTLAGLALSILVTVNHLSRHILVPLNSVADSIRRVAQGDLNARPVAGDRSLGEAAQLADDFNALANQLQHIIGPGMRPPLQKSRVADSTLDRFVAIEIAGKSNRQLPGLVPFVASGAARTVDHARQRIVQKATSRVKNVPKSNACHSIWKEGRSRALLPGALVPRGRMVGEAQVGILEEALGLGIKQEVRHKSNIPPHVVNNEYCPRDYDISTRSLVIAMSCKKC